MNSPPPPYGSWRTEGFGAFRGMGVGPAPPMPPLPPMPVFAGMPAMPPMPNFAGMPPMPAMPHFSMFPSAPAPPPFTGYQTPEAPKKEEAKKKEAAKKEAKTEDAKIPGLALPGGLTVGHTFLYNSHYTSLHIITTPDAKPWDTPGADFSFSIFKADCDWSVAKLLDRLGKKADECVVTECVELGQGKWVKGTSVEGKGDKGKTALRAAGWDEKRGVDRPPVWLVVHKA
ncbi:hypothetical protein K490DRAFT_55940 [Saccharata proteae CBS 121410]|uniref:Uncharacterized protein n=1 Tax=Saccharata proteae CBS 121410 TaxID=1314787 RepID=A0A9P4LZW3_9PEZI|nr:hypothetical protein K490DRAFT_55940 [Saccharata proteae CBS 121410]